MDITEVADLGSFEVTSGRLIVTDPCYAADGHCQGFVENAALGVWRGTAYMTECMGRRVARLVVLHESLDGEPLERGWETEPFEVCVDSGQAGVFDAARYPPGGGDDEEFYGRACSATLDTPARGGAIAEGILASSGFGDGGYAASTYRRREDGAAVAVRIDFITDEDEEED